METWVETLTSRSLLPSFSRLGHAQKIHGWCRCTFINLIIQSPILVAAGARKRVILAIPIPVDPRSRSGPSNARTSAPRRSNHFPQRHIDLAFFLDAQMSGGSAIRAATLGLTIVGRSQTLANRIRTIAWCNGILLVWEEVWVDIVLLMSSPLGCHLDFGELVDRDVVDIALMLACVCCLFVGHGVGGVASFYAVFCVVALDGEACVNNSRTLERSHCIRGEGVGWKRVVSRLYEGGKSWSLFGWLVAYVPAVRGTLRLVGKIIVRHGRFIWESGVLSQTSSHFLVWQRGTASRMVPLDMAGRIGISSYHFEFLSKVSHSRYNLRGFR
jgi:hypothetical protein